jgi:hypothetical protein
MLRGWGLLGWLLAALVGVLPACRGAERGGSSQGANRSGAAGAPASARSPLAVSAAESIAMARDVWNKPEVVRRLTEGGLVVIDPHQRVLRRDLHVVGDRLQVGRGELEIYVYDDAAARRRDAAGLDTLARGLPRIDRPRYIISGNLIAVLRAPDERLAERVENVLTARHTGGSVR